MSATIENVGVTLRRIARRLDMILVVLLAQSGLNQTEIADILGISARTIQRWLPFRQIKKKREEQ